MSGDGTVGLTCMEVRQETPTVRTFAFRADRPLDHRAGQAMTLALPVDGAILHRTFSISSAPRRDALVEMTIKAHPQGVATAWLHRTLEPGDSLRARPPAGRFTLDRRSNPALAFVSGGSGATPLMAMLRHLAASEPAVDVAWLHAASDPGELLFTEALANLQRIMPNLTIALVVSRPVPGWFGYRGRISRRLIGAAIPDLPRRDVFCCGPTEFMTAARLIHAAEGGAREAFHTEAFGPVTAPQPPAPGPGTPAFSLTIGDRVIAVRPEESVLQAALRQGVIIPCGCGQGLCGTCRVRRLEGEVDLRHQGGLSPEEERAGFLLACSTRLRSDGAIAL